MAKEVTLKFSLQALEAANAMVARIGKRVEEAEAAGNELTRIGERLTARGRAIRQQVRAGERETLRGQGARIERAREIGGQVAGAAALARQFADDPLTAGLQVAAAAPIPQVRILAAVALTIKDIVIPLIEKENAKQRELLLSELRLEVAQMQRDFDRRRMQIREQATRFAARQAAQEVRQNSARSLLSGRLEGL